MAGIFEEFLNSNTQLTESLRREKSKVVEAKKPTKISYKKIRLESRKLIHEASEDEVEELDQQFSVDPEDTSDESDEVVLVIDPEIPADEEVPEDAAEDMIGDLVYKCPVCGANYVCDCDAAETESIEVDENGVPTECPICGDTSDQILIGEIAPADEVNEDDEQEMEPVEPEEDEEDEEFEETEEEEEVKEESLKSRKRRKSVKEASHFTTKDTSKENVKRALSNWFRDYHIEEGKVYQSASIDEDGGEVDSRTLEDCFNEYFGRAEESPGERSWGSNNSLVLDMYDEIVYLNGAPLSESKNIRKSVKESSLGSKVDKYQKWVDYDMDHYGKISKRTDKFLADAGLEVVKDQYGDYEVIAKSKKEACGMKECDEPKKTKNSLRKKKTVKEDIEEFTDEVEVDDVCPECGSDPCVCDSVDDLTLDTSETDDAPAVEINADVVNLTLDESKLNTLMTNMLRENYKGTNSFKAKSARKLGNKLMIEYIVHNGKKVISKGTLIAEGFNKNSRKFSLRVKDKGAFTESYTRTPSFVMECVKLRNKIIPTSLKYNFIKRVNEQVYRVKGQSK